MVHRPSGIRVPREAGPFHLDDGGGFVEFMGAFAYAATADRGTAQISFYDGGDDGCESDIALIADDKVRRAEFKQRIGQWRNLAPFFHGMETGRAAAYESSLRVDGAESPARSGVYILCGSGARGSWHMRPGTLLASTVARGSTN
jgi:hypothetical protein